MSGHSKWSTIKRQKGVNDAKRGQVFTKLSNAITLAVKTGGSADPNFNFKLRLAIDAARSANMPKDNIDRAVTRASGKSAGEMEEGLYEGFGPQGVSIMLETVSDNIQRTVSEIKSTLDKNGGSLGSMGSVAYQFNQVGLLVIPKQGLEFDELFLQAVEAGAIEVEDGGEEAFVYTNVEELKNVSEALKEMQITESALIRRPSVMIELSTLESAEKFLSLLEKLEDLGDVQKVYTNAQISAEIMKQLS